MQKFTAQIDNQSCTKTILDNDQETFHCTCKDWTQSMKSGVPCKHICALLFSEGNTSKWEYMVLKYARQYKMTNAHNVLAKSLRNPYFKEDDPLSVFALWLKRIKNDFDIETNRRF